jgi:type VI secretion system protein ImpI
MEQKISIQISNIEVLERNTKPNHIFDFNGGSIGADESDTWYIYDRSGCVKANHARIKVIDDHYCLEQVQGDVYVNQASYPLGNRALAKLHDADQIEIGKFKLRVQFSLDNDFSVDLNALLEQVVEEQEQTTLLIDENYIAKDREIEVENNDPEWALSQSIVMSESKDPNSYFDAQDQLDNPRNELSDFIYNIDAQDESLEGVSWRDVSHIEIKNGQDDITKQTNSSCSKESKGVYNMSNDFSSKMEDLEDLVMGHNGSAIKSIGVNATQKSRSHGINEIDHLASSPLQRGLGVGLSQVDTEQIHEVLEELGMTLKEAVQGLLKIHDSAKMQGSGLNNKILQPIEDNPLRLGLDYPQTMAAMFDSDRSKVHLAAPMAVKESLTQIMLHQLATQHATNQALDAILQALNPSTLSVRFKRYRGSFTRDEESQEGWAWEMYKHYYQELVSSRQQGFEKLYSEVFEQAYDQKLRELQQEEMQDA